MDHSDSGNSLAYVMKHFILGLFNKVTVTYLPQYIPSGDEIVDPQLYADNVRNYYQSIIKLPFSNCIR